MTRRLQRIGVIMGVFGAMMVVPAFSAQPRDSINPDNLRQAINDMIKTFDITRVNKYSRYIAMQFQ